MPNDKIFVAVLLRLTVNSYKTLKYIDWVISAGRFSLRRSVS